MKRILLILIIAFMVPTVTFAQKLYGTNVGILGYFSPGGNIKITKNKIILEMSVESEMPEGAQTTSPKIWSGTVDNTTTTPAMAGNLPDGLLNRTVYYKLEIAPTDINSDGEIANFTFSSRNVYENGTGWVTYNDVVTGLEGVYTMDWATAFNGCKNSTYDGGGWRLPTQKELQMMWIFQLGFDYYYPSYSYTARVKIAEDTYNYAQSFIFRYQYADYWCATENVTTTGVVSAYSVNFYTGNGPASSKTASYWARCVREL